MEAEERKEIKHTMISIDLDSLDEAALSKTLQILDKNHFNKNVWYGLSPGGKGYHVQANCEMKDGLTLRQLFCLRRMAGDDPHRIFIDSMGSRHLDVLFDWKEKRECRHVK